MKKLQYSSQDEMDEAVIDYCRGQSRYEAHYRTRTALNGFYSPFALAAVAAPKEAIRRSALRSVRQLTAQILEIQEQFLPELWEREIAHRVSSLNASTAGSLVDLESGKGNGNRTAVQSLQSPTPAPKPRVSGNPAAPIDEQLRQFLGDDAAIMANLNPFANDLI